MADVMTWVLSSPEVAARMITWLKENAGTYAKSGKPLQITAAPYRETRSKAQNSWMWVAVLTPASEQIITGGRSYSPQVWNEYLKEKFLPEICAKGLSKWEQMPDGTRRLVMSTSDLNVEEMTGYLDEIQAHLSTEYGVLFS